MLHLTPQTITGQIKSLEERLDGKLFKRQGRGLVPSELGQLVYRYADKMFTLSQEMLDIVNYRKEASLLFDVGVADALSKRLVSRVLEAAVPDNAQIHLRCFESTHEMLLEQLSQHKLDMILSDCPVDSTQQAGLFSVKLGESPISFFCCNPPADMNFPACLERRSLLIPGRRSMLGRKLLNWFNTQGLKVNILGEFDDAALMKAFGMNNDAIFVAPAIYSSTEFQDEKIEEVGRVEGIMEEYYVIFAERMIQHPSVQRICHTDFSALFE
ncbi:UNVERIFIED_ORG: LysR family transcriptional activator of nhaA [Rahnella aquatilis]